ncbi:hypothetical protein EJ04DRAFT_606969 [Polyplosphaeria fusca]|uniref:Uncharacterized protein n=1 Tax=Polyplosphaeria fusca TaxID=682080 RepID=A0A9P4QXV6_9PLEO|nr:hypothetical protein EJ04DRAFT_606969 [Polyplosphaeria fusca]
MVKVATFITHSALHRRTLLACCGANLSLCARSCKRKHATSTIAQREVASMRLKSSGPSLRYDASQNVPTDDAEVSGTTRLRRKAAVKATSTPDQNETPCTKRRKIEAAINKGAQKGQEIQESPAAQGRPFKFILDTKAALSQEARTDQETQETPAAQIRAFKFVLDKHCRITKSPQSKPTEPSQDTLRGHNFKQEAVEMDQNAVPTGSDFQHLVRRAVAEREAQAHTQGRSMEPQHSLTPEPPAPFVPFPGMVPRGLARDLSTTNDPVRTLFDDETDNRSNNAPVHFQAPQPPQLQLESLSSWDRTRFPDPVPMMFGRVPDGQHIGWYQGLIVTKNSLGELHVSTDLGPRPLPLSAIEHIKFLDPEDYYTLLPSLVEPQSPNTMGGGGQQGNAYATSASCMNDNVTGAASSPSVAVDDNEEGILSSTEVENKTSKAAKRKRQPTEKKRKRNEEDMGLAKKLAKRQIRRKTRASKSLREQSIDDDTDFASS